MIFLELVDPDNNGSNSLHHGDVLVQSLFECLIFGYILSVIITLSLHPGPYTCSEASELEAPKFFDPSSFVGDPHLSDSVGEGVDNLRWKINVSTELGFAINTNIESNLSAGWFVLVRDVEHEAELLSVLALNVATCFLALELIRIGADSLFWLFVLILS